MITDHFLTRAKAYAALVGLIATYLLGQVPADSGVHQALVIIGGLATVIGTYAVPNKAPAKTKR